VPESVLLRPGVARNYGSDTPRRSASRLPSQSTTRRTLRGPRWQNGARVARGLARRTRVFSGSTVVAVFAVGCWSWLDPRREDCSVLLVVFVLGGTHLL
jgi:hypothetical protein